MNDDSIEGERVRWNEIYRRLEVARARTEEGWDPGEEARKRVLKARARLLAKVPEKLEVEEEFLEIVEFLLAGEKYGIGSSHIREVYPLRELTPLPGTPDFILGVMNVRGRIVSVTDLKKFLNLRERGLGELNKVIVLSGPGMEFGIVADEISGNRRVRLQAAPSLGYGESTGIGRFLMGITPDGTSVLDGQRILFDPRIIVNRKP